jgi:hypothetical protein
VLTGSVRWRRLPIDETPLVPNLAFIRASDQVSAAKRFHAQKVLLCPF